MNQTQTTPVTVHELDDSRLIDLITEKNEAALSELYDRYHRLIFTVARNVVGRQEEAEEVTLDVFVRVWEKAHTYQTERAKVYTWLTRLARNRAIDVLRREDVRPLKHSVRWADVAPIPSANSNTPETATHLALQQQRVRQAMTTLPDTQKEVLALAYFQGYTHSEIAHALNLPLGTVKGRIRAGMQKLRAFLQDE